MNQRSRVSDLAAAIAISLVSSFLVLLPLEPQSAKASYAWLTGAISSRPASLFFEFEVTAGASNRVEIPLIGRAPSIGGPPIFTKFYNADGTEIYQTGSQTWSQGSLAGYDQIQVAKAYDLTPGTEKLIVEIEPNAGAEIYGLGRLRYDTNALNIGTASCEGNEYQGTWANWSEKLVAVHSFGNSSNFKTMCGAFYLTNKLTSVAKNLPVTVANLQATFQDSAFNGELSWSVPNVTTMKGMFYRATSLSSTISFTTSGLLSSLQGFLEEASNFNAKLTITDTSGVQNFANMFAGATRFNQPVDFNTHSATDMQTMFWRASEFNQPISGWHTRNVTNMFGMFSGATAFNQSLEFDCTNVTDMSYMFNTATSFNSPITFSNTAKVTDMSYMFIRASAFNQDVNLITTSLSNTSEMFNLATNFNSAVSFSDTSNVTNMFLMFGAATNFNKPLQFSTARVTNMSAMFQNATSFNSTISFSDTSRVTNMSYMFYGANNFNQPINFDIASATNLRSMFSGASSFNAPLTLSNTSNVTNLSFMFYRANNFNQPINFDTTNVTTMHALFSFASNFDQPLNWTTSRVTNMSYMFSSASNFNQEVNFSTSQVTDMTAMFLGAANFDQPIRFETPSVSSMAGMFYEAARFNSLVSFSDTSRVTDMSHMFNRASVFDQPLSMSTASVNDMTAMFFRAVRFNQPIAFSTSTVTSMSAMFGDASSFNQSLNFDMSNVTDATEMFLDSGLSCANYDHFLNAISVSARTGAVNFAGTSYTPAGQAARDALIAKGWIVADTRCLGAWPVETTNSGSNSSAKIPEFFALEDSLSSGQELILNGSNLSVVQKLFIGGQEAQILTLANSKITIQVPNLGAGKYDLVVLTNQGKVSYLNFVTIISASAVAASQVSTYFIKVNPRSSQLSQVSEAQISSKVLGWKSTVCIAYYEKGNIKARLKAHRRAVSACDLAEAAGAEIRTYVYGNAPARHAQIKLVLSH